MSKVQIMKIGLSLVSHIEPILESLTKIKGKQEHGKNEIIEYDKKFFAVYREYFDNEQDAQNFIEFCNRVYTLKKDELPPISIFNILFKALFPVMTYKTDGKQTHGRPELIRKNNKYCVVLKEVFENKEDAKRHIELSNKLQNSKL